jgi:hypothetical protein
MVYRSGMRFRLLFVLALLAPAGVTHADTQVSPWIYVNRCTGGCVVHGASNDDARTQTSTLPCNDVVETTGGAFCNSPGGTWTVSEFADSNGNTGSAADAEWNQIVACMQKVYSPYAVTVTDQLPPGGVSYNEAIVAGLPSDIGYPGSVGGIAPTIYCAARDDVISFSFANTYPGSSDRALVLCAVAAQETAHSYGLDHAFTYASNGQPACTDPMTYQPWCGPRFFRNAFMTCGEYQPRQCFCGGTQNSHLKLLSIFGPGTPTTAPPHVTISTPAAGAQVANGEVVHATAGAERGIDKMELWLNGYKWAEAPGAPFGQSGQPDTDYPLAFPANVPDGVIDIVVKAYDDLPVETDSATVTVTKGAPCVDASTCLTGQKCEAGKCFWDPPTGELGDACTYPQFCKSGECTDTSEGMLCTQDCIPTASGTCPAMYDCVDEGNGSGACVPSVKSGGCCDAGGDGSPWLPVVMSAGVLAVVLRQRRRS